MVPALTAQSSVHGATTVVALAGELDLSTVATLEGELEKASGAVVIDLRGLDFMDSSGLRMIVLADARAREGGHRLALVRGPEPIHRVFELTRMAERLDFVEGPADLG